MLCLHFTTRFEMKEKNQNEINYYIISKRVPHCINKIVVYKMIVTVYIKAFLMSDVNGTETKLSWIS